MHGGSALLPFGNPADYFLCRLAEVAGFEPAYHGFGDRCFPFRPHPNEPVTRTGRTQFRESGLV